MNIITNNKYLKLSDIFPLYYNMYNYSLNALTKIKKIILIKRFLNENNYNIIFNLDKNSSSSTIYSLILFTKLLLNIINKFNDIKLKKELINKNIAKQIIIGEFYSYLLSDNIDFNSRKMKLIKKLLIERVKLWQK